MPITRRQDPHVTLLHLARKGVTPKAPPLNLLNLRILQLRLFEYDLDLNSLEHRTLRDEFWRMQLAVAIQD